MVFSIDVVIVDLFPSFISIILVKIYQTRNSVFKIRQNTPLYMLVLRNVVNDCLSCLKHAMCMEFNFAVYKPGHFRYLTSTNITFFFASQIHQKNYWYLLREKNRSLVDILRTSDVLVIYLHSQNVFSNVCAFSSICVLFCN